MAEPDHGTDAGMTPDDPSSAGSAPAEGKTAAPPTPVVRKSAPLRRNKPKGAAAPRGAYAVGTPAPSPGAVPDAVPDTGSDGAPGTGPETADTVGTAETAPDTTPEIAPDPSEVERGVGYRQRRQGHGGPTPQPGVTYSKSASTTSSTPLGWVIMSSLATVVLVIGVALSAAFAIGTHRYDTQNELRAEYSTFAKQMIVNLTTLNKDNVDEALKTLEDKTSGKAKQQMQDSMKQAAGLISEQNLNTKTTILSDAVTKAEQDEGSVMVVYGWQMDPVEKGEEMTVQTFRWRVDITRINGDLKMTNFEWVT